MSSINFKATSFPHPKPNQKSNSPANLPQQGPSSNHAVNLVNKQLALELCPKIFQGDTLKEILKNLNLFEVFEVASVSKQWVEAAKDVLPFLLLNYPLYVGDVYCGGKIDSPEGRMKLPKGFFSSLYLVYNSKYRKKFEQNRWSDLFSFDGRSVGPMMEEDDEAYDSAEGKELLVDVLKRINFTKFNSVSIVPRGLNNPDNKCFLNVVLQSLLGSQSFRHLLKECSKANIPKSDFPFLQKMVRFYNQFSHLGSGNQCKYGLSFTPRYFYETLIEFNPITTSWQEDAQEYLCFLLDKLNCEVAKAFPKSSSPVDNGDGWIDKTGKNKSAILLNRSGEFEESYITEIFGGTFRSIVSKKGLPSSSRIEPFFCLHLDIQADNIKNLEHALNHLTEKEKIEGYQDKGAEVPASKQIKIEKTPENLIIHLKRFAYDRKTYIPYKIHKMLSFHEYFTLNGNWLFTTSKACQYQLYSVISHLGPQTQGGHYTCDLYHDTYGQWIHYDDSKVTVVDDLENFFNKNNNAYLLFYRKVK